MLLSGRRQVVTADPRDAVLSLKQISLDFPAGTTEAKASELAANCAQATRTIAGCGGADAVAQQLGASVVSRDNIDMRAQLGRAHVRTPVTNAHLVCRLLLEKIKMTILLINASHPH